jgi:hypothetical protein
MHFTPWVAVSKDLSIFFVNIPCGPTAATTATTTAANTSIYSVMFCPMRECLVKNCLRRMSISLNDSLQISGHREL